MGIQCINVNSHSLQDAGLVLGQALIIHKWSSCTLGCSHVEVLQRHRQPVHHILTLAGTTASTSTSTKELRKYIHTTRHSTSAHAFLDRLLPILHQKLDLDKSKKRLSVLMHAPPGLHAENVSAAVFMTVTGQCKWLQYQLPIAKAYVKLDNKYGNIGNEGTWS